MNLTAKPIRTNKSICILAAVIATAFVAFAETSQHVKDLLFCTHDRPFFAWVHRTIWNCIHVVERMPLHLGNGENDENSRLWLQPKRFNMTVFLLLFRSRQFSFNERTAFEIIEWH